MVLTYEQQEHPAPGKTSEHEDIVRGRFLELIPNERIVQAVEFESEDPRLRRRDEDDVELDPCSRRDGGLHSRRERAENIVYSRTIGEPRSARTRIERVLDPDAVRRLESTIEHDVSVDGPELAAQAIQAGPVDEFQMIVCRVLVGGGKRFFPDDVRLDLTLVEQRRFGNGVVLLRYTVRR
jgi:riboflavin biosynthesis pyrimidine reductase